MREIKDTCSLIKHSKTIFEDWDLGTVLKKLNRPQKVRQSYKEKIMQSGQKTILVAFAMLLYVCIRQEKVHQLLFILLTPIKTLGDFSFRDKIVSMPIRLDFKANLRPSARLSALDLLFQILTWKSRLFLFNCSYNLSDMVFIILLIACY